jgi:hypothetical protein
MPDVVKKTTKQDSTQVSNGAQKLASVVNQYNKKAANAAYRKLPEGVKEVIGKNRAIAALTNAQKQGNKAAAAAAVEAARAAAEAARAAAEAAAAAASNTKTSTTESHNIYLI